MGRPVSIGARWTIRYTAAILLTFVGFATYAYTQISERIDRDARVLLRLQMQELADGLRKATATPAELTDAVLEAAVADPNLRMSVQFFDAAARLRNGRGVLASRNVPLPEQLLSGSQDSLFYEIDLGDDYPYHVLATKVDPGFVQIAMYSREFARSKRRLRDVLLTSAPIIVLITMALGWWLSQASLRPLDRITTTARRITVANLDEVIPTTASGDELDRLAQTLNEMMHRIRDSVETLRAFSSDAAHQLRTPLTALRSRLEVTLDGEPMSDELRRALTAALEEMEILEETVTSMLQLASSEAGLHPGQGKALCLVSLVDSVVEFYKPLAAEQGVSLECHAARDATVVGELPWLRQLFSNLIENALQHTPPGGRVAVNMERSEGQLRVRVRDSGSGIEAEQLDRIFDRFYRVPSPKQPPGIGLGLTVARQIARAHGGEIEAESVRGVGSTFTVSLRAAETAAS